MEIITFLPLLEIVVSATFHILNDMYKKVKEGFCLKPIMLQGKIFKTLTSILDGFSEYCVLAVEPESCNPVVLTGEGRSM